MSSILELNERRKMLEDKIKDINESLEYYKIERRIVERFRKIVRNFSYNYPKDMYEIMAARKIYERMNYLLDRIDDEIDHHVSGLMLYRESLIDELRKVEDEMKKQSGGDVS
jgi:hypothetical protein